MAIRTDPTQAFEMLYDEHFADVFAYALRRAARPLAEDVTAETFLVAWRRADKVPSDALPWLLGIARRVLANDRRASVRRQALDKKLETDVFTAPHEWAELDSDLVAGLLALTDVEREAVLLAAWEDLTPAQASRVVACSPTAMRLRLFRARRQLRIALKPPSSGAAAVPPSSHPHRSSS